MTGPPGPVLIDPHNEWAIAERRSVAEGAMALLGQLVDDEQTKNMNAAKSFLLAS